MSFTNVRVVDVPSPAHFDAAMAELARSGGRVFVLFTGAKDATGVSWCPDCTRAEVG